MKGDAKTMHVQIATSSMYARPEARAIGVYVCMNMYQYVTETPETEMENGPKK